MNSAHDASEPLSVVSSKKPVLELEKLKLEIEEIKGRNRWADRIARYIPLISGLIAVAAFVFGVIQYTNQQKENVRALDRQIQSNKETNEREFRKPLWEKTLALHFEASAAAATISRTKDPAIRKKAEETFWQLYQGPLAIVEDTDVSTAMANFGDCLDGTAKCSDEHLGELSLKLASTIQHSLSKSWNVPIGSFTEGKFDYRKRE